MRKKSTKYVQLSFNDWWLDNYYTVVFVAHNVSEKINNI